MSIESMNGTLEQAKRKERHRTNAETRYWCDQYKQIATEAVNALAKQGHTKSLYGANWSVFNTGACVADGLTMEEAKEYMTPERIARGWTAVYCVVVKSDDQWPTQEAA